MNPEEGESHTTLDFGMEDSGIHLEDSPTNFCARSKVMTYPCSPNRQVTVTSTTTTTTTSERDCLADDRTEGDSIGSRRRHNGASSRDPPPLTSSQNSRVTLEIVGRDVVVDDVTVSRRRQSPSADLLTLQRRSISPGVPLKLSLSGGCEGVRVFRRSEEVDPLDPVKVDPTSLGHEEVFLSAPEAPSEEAEEEGVGRRAAKEKSASASSSSSSAGMTKIQKFFEPLRRRRSTGNAKESKEEQQTFTLFFSRSVSRKEERLSTDTGNGSMESELDRESAVAEDSPRLDQNKWRNLSSEMKEKFSIFMKPRGGVDSSGHFKDTGRREKMTLETVGGWSKSFQNLLTDKNGLRWFREFLKSEFSEENVEFWIACEEYKHLKTHKMASQAQKIFTQFVAYQAPREINIDSTTRDLTYENMKRPEVTTFEAAQKRIESLMEKDSYPRFIESDLYGHLLTGLRSS